MRRMAVVLALAFAYGVSQPALLRAAGSGQHGGHSSGHGGGHSSHGSSHGSGHATSRPGGGTHTTGTHSTGSRTSSTPHAATATRSDGTPSTLTPTTGTRPRDGRPIVGTAVPRPEIIPAAVPGAFFSAPLIIFPRYAPGFRFGSFGYYGYSPFGYYAPYDTYPLPDNYAADPFDLRGPTGKLRLHVEPSSADVFVDGYHAGIVDDFNGVLQRLTLAAGPHHIVVNAPGYQPLEFDVLIAPHQTTTYRGALKR
jgi:hypothetical protein